MVIQNLEFGSVFYEALRRAVNNYGDKGTIEEYTPGYGIQSIAAALNLQGTEGQLVRITIRVSRPPPNSAMGGISGLKLTVKDNITITDINCSRDMMISALLFGPDGNFCPDSFNDNIVLSAAEKAVTVLFTACFSVPTHPPG